MKDKHGKTVSVGDFVEVQGRWYVVCDVDGDVFLRGMSKGRRIILDDWSLVRACGVVVEDTTVPVGHVFVNQHGENCKQIHNVGVLNL